MNNQNIPEVEVGSTPQAIIRRDYFSKIVWIIPILALMSAGWMLYQRQQGFGPKITILFSDSNGVKAGETLVRYRGVDVGLVEEVSLNSDLKKAKLIVRLKRQASDLAKTNSSFWIVRPEVGENAISGLGTVFSGPYIGVLPGDGEKKLEFEGLGRAPPAANHPGISVVLFTPHIKNVAVNSPVYFRGAKVGYITDIEVGGDATVANATAYIEEPYSKLLEPGSKFWTIGGANVQGGLLSGVDVKIESLRTLFIGGVTFASPGDGNRVSTGTRFALADEPKEEWLDWSPKITLSGAQIKKHRDDQEKSANESVGPASLKREK